MTKIKELYNTHKIRITTEVTSENVTVFRLEVKWMGRTMHANISSIEAANISEVIYQNLPEEIIEKIAENLQEIEN